MAFSTTAAVGGHAGSLIPPFYSDFLRENLWPSMYFRQLGTKITIPKGYGDRVKIPRWDTPIVTTSGQAAPDGAVTAVTAGLGEGTIPTAKSLSAEDITGEVEHFEGVRSYTNKLILVAKANFVEGALESLGRELAFDIDRYTRQQLTANATTRIATGATKAPTTAVLRGKEIARIGPYFDSNNTPRWEDNSLVGIAHPLTQYDIYSDISATGFVSVARYNDAIKVYRGEVGQMFGIRFLLSNAVPIYSGAGGSTSANDGMSGGATGANVWVFAPDAFYSLELEDGGLEVLHMPPGSSGALNDPTAKVGTISVNVYYGVVAAPSGDQRLMRFAHGLGLGY